MTRSQFIRQPFVMRSTRTQRPREAQKAQGVPLAPCQTNAKSWSYLQGPV